LPRSSASTCKPAEQPDGRQRVRLAILGNLVDVVVARPGESDQTPAGEVAVAAVHRIGEKAFLRVLQKHAEEALGRHIGELDVALLQPGENLILIGRRQGGEGLAGVGAPAMVVDVADRDAIKLRGRQLELVPLLIGSFQPGTLHVPGVGAAVGAGQLALDEEGDCGTLGAEAVVAIRNQPLRRRLDETTFVIAEERVERRPRQFGAAHSAAEYAEHGQGQCRLDERASRSGKDWRDIDRVGQNAGIPVEVPP